MTKPETYEWNNQQLRLTVEDCRIMISQLADNSVDSVITDPPYELNFMNNQWDRTGITYDTNLWRDIFRVVKPGAYLCVFSATRTYHRLACAIENAGFEIRDQIDWVYMTGWPRGENYETACAREHTPVNPQYVDHHTQLKPMHEPICVARKPCDGTIVHNVTQYGTGLLNIHDTRIPITSQDYQSYAQAWQSNTTKPKTRSIYGTYKNNHTSTPSDGRFTPNMIIDEQTARQLHAAYGLEANRFIPIIPIPKPDTSQRPNVNGIIHPTVKPVPLMQWLIRLITPVNGIILEPFAGSGTTLQAAQLENRRCVASELNPQYVPLIQQRLSHPITPSMF